MHENFFSNLDDFGGYNENIISNGHKFCIAKFSLVLHRRDDSVRTIRWADRTTALSLNKMHSINSPLCVYPVPATQNNIFRNKTNFQVCSSTNQLCKAISVRE